MEQMIEPFKISGNLVDVHVDEVRGVEITVGADGTIASIEPCENPQPGYLMPGFVDAHVHIESSMLLPAVFADTAIRHGTLGAVTDPHEIANVAGIDGVRSMMEWCANSDFVFGIGAPSCVPSISFESCRQVIGPAEIAELMAEPDVTHLSEVMNVPGVLGGDKELMAKIRSAIDAGKPIDGHAPELSGHDLAAYLAAGISTDHECVEYSEALEKVKAGMIVMIRGGSAAKLNTSLLGLLNRFSGKCMFCSDDKHPDDLLKGHINSLAAEAYRHGVPLTSVVRAACVNPVHHYKLPLGLLREGDRADFIRVCDLSTFNPVEVFRAGCKFDLDSSRLDLNSGDTFKRDCLNSKEVDETGLKVEADDNLREIRIIGAEDGLLVTRTLHDTPLVCNGTVCSDPERDILKIAVVSRYRQELPAVGFIRGFGLKHGALATSVSHDSHNIICVGATDKAMVSAINRVIFDRGGLAVADDGGNVLAALPLPVVGLMSDKNAEFVACRYQDCDRLAKMMGAKLSAPFMTLSFMALPVIPEIKMTDKGMFDTCSFRQAGVRFK